MSQERSHDPALDHRLDRIEQRLLVIETGLRQIEHQLEGALAALAAFHDLLAEADDYEDE